MSTDYSIAIRSEAFNRHMTANVYQESNGLYRARVTCRRNSASGIGGTPRSAVRQALAELWTDYRTATAGATGAPSLTCHKGFTKAAHHYSLPINLIGCSDYAPAQITL